MSTGMPRRLPTFWQLAWTLRRVRGDRHGINQGSGEGVRATQKEIFVYKPRLMPVLMDPISFFVPDRILRRSVRNFVPRGLRWADSRPAKIYCKLADNRPQEDDDPTDSNFGCLSQGHCPKTESMWRWSSACRWAIADRQRETAPHSAVVVFKYCRFCPRHSGGTQARQSM